MDLPFPDGRQALHAASSTTASSDPSPSAGTAHAQELSERDVAKRAQEVHASLASATWLMFYVIARGCMTSSDVAGRKSGIDANWAAKLKNETDA
jgi:hypothetical protein